MRQQTVKSREIRPAVIKSGLKKLFTSFMFPEKIFCSSFVYVTNRQSGINRALIPMLRFE